MERLIIQLDAAAALSFVDKNASMEELAKHEETHIVTNTTLDDLMQDYVENKQLQIIATKVVGVHPQDKDHYNLLKTKGYTPAADKEFLYKIMPPEVMIINSKHIRFIGIKEWEAKKLKEETKKQTPKKK